MTEESSLEKVLEKMFDGSPNGVRVQRKQVIDVTSETAGLIVSIFPQDRYAQFDGEFKQNAPLHPDLRPLVKYLDENGYQTNLD